MLFEVFSEEGLRREVQLLRNLVNALVGVFQQGLRFENHRLVDPTGGRLATHLADRRREVFRGEVELLGIETYIALLAAVLLQKAHEVVEDDAAAPLVLLLRLLVVVDLGDDVEGRREERADDLVAVALLVAVEQLLHQAEDLQDLGDLLLRDAQDGREAELHVDRQRGG